MISRVFAALFAVLFLAGAITVFLIQPSGTANAGLTSGFVLPIEMVSHIVILVSTGVLAAWLGREAVMLVPLCVLLVLVITAFLQMDDHADHIPRAFILGAILLFSISISTLDAKSRFSILPLTAWVYLTGENYLQHVPSITTPLYFLLGLIISTALLMAIGVALGVTLTESAHDSLEKLKTLRPVEKFKNLRPVSTFLSIF